MIGGPDHRVGSFVERTVGDEGECGQQARCDGAQRIGHAGAILADNRTIAASVSTLPS